MRSGGVQGAIWGNTGCDLGMQSAIWGNLELIWPEISILGLGCDLGEYRVRSGEDRVRSGQNEIYSSKKFSEPKESNKKKLYLKRPKNKRVMAKTKPAKKLDHPVEGNIFKFLRN